MPGPVRIAAPRIGQGGGHDSDEPRQRRRAVPAGLADVIETILDKGMVIDAYVRVSLAGIEVLTIDARVVIAGVDTYLRFAEAVNRLDIASDGTAVGLPELGQTMSGGDQRR